MPEFTTPGVYIAEGAPAHRIAGVASDSAGFAGIAESLKDAPPGNLVTTAAGFAARWAATPTIGTGVPNLLWPAVEAYFANGGDKLHIAPVTEAAALTGGYADAIAALAATDAAIIAAPDVQALPPPWTGPGHGDAVMAALVAAAELPGSNRFAVLDAPPGLDIAGVLAWRAGFDTPAAALYWPWLRTASGDIHPPSAYAAGVIARETRERGVWKSPANADVRGIADPVLAITDAGQDRLNPEGVNAIRRFEARGVRIWGARTLARDPQWRSVAHRRLATFLQVSIARGLGWTAFEAGGPALWARVTAVVGDFLFERWREGAFAGSTPVEAYFVHCGPDTMTADDIAQGRLVVLFGHAPFRPGEFVVARILARQA